MARFRNRKIGLNDFFKDDELFTNRGVEKITQYVTPKFKNPTQKELDKIPFDVYYWSVGDRYFKLAQKYYNDQSLWYLIALFNKKPTEAQIKAGDEIRIPTDVRLALEIIG